MYRNYVKRIFDIIISLIALIILSPILCVLTVVGFFQMKGNPFFYQERPGKNGKIFGLIKFRSMSNAKDKNGKLLPDNVRLNSYGKLIRKLSLDELPELINILKGDMSIVGPRPLAVQYLPYYNDEEKRRHDVLPGLTGLAQINGRNCVNWPERFAYDIEYVDNVSFMLDVKIILKTVVKVVKKSDIAVRASGEIIDFDKFRIKQNMEIQRKKSNV
ncbi:sugar transferase [Massilimicrobiota sp. An142]|uniref:sugar transferase n=1 Tax=Massilimicrobiota sp. An142 TaxID=1965564 RepID=UPI000B392B40|nr:sugar transferase [Massilimicrobiota sp. An142]OUQ14432.1 sugar transferase [Massilimicrobiota sp. An142]